MDKPNVSNKMMTGSIRHLNQKYETEYIPFFPLATGVNGGLSWVNTFTILNMSPGTTSRSYGECAERG